LLIHRVRGKQRAGIADRRKHHNGVCPRGPSKERGRNWRERVGNLIGWSSDNSHIKEKRIPVQLRDFKLKNVYSKKGKKNSREVSGPT